MKLNPKVYKNLNGEPFEVQSIDGVKVAFYDMNETNYLAQYASRGKFAIWTSNGGDDYKVLIEKSYYEALKPFYEYDVNKIWLGFLNQASEITKKVNMYFIIPTMVLYLVLATVSAIFFQDLMIQVLIGLLVVVFVSNIFQTRITSKRVRESNIKAQEDIRNTLGTDTFDELVKAQEEHYKNYFKFDEPDASVENLEEPVEETDKKGDQK